MLDQKLMGDGKKKDGQGVASKINLFGCACQKARVLPSHLPILGTSLFNGAPVESEEGKIDHKSGILVNQ